MVRDKNVKHLIDRIVSAPAEQKSAILDDVRALARLDGYGAALTALYRQQINSGFVLADPAKYQSSNKSFIDPVSGVTFIVQLNPDRDIRSNYAELIKRGVIADGVDASILINKDADGRPCYLCKENIKVQNPKEILFELCLAGQTYFAGANFAPLAINHFTVIRADHRSQRYAKAIVPVMRSFTDLVNGSYGAVFNGLAGASIVEHEHFHATTTHFPVERIRVDPEDIVFESDGIRVSRPKYYLPLFIVEGANNIETEEAANRIIAKWHDLDAGHNTENIILVKTDDMYRVFIFLRDTKLLRPSGKKGAIAAFECGGCIITSEAEFWHTADLESIKLILADVAPDAGPIFFD